VLELLVVMGIMAVLAALLFPVIARAQNAAKMVSCANNERSLYVAVVAFANDHDGHLPNPAQEGQTYTSSWGPYVCFAMDPTNGGEGVLDLVHGTLWPYMPPTGSGRQQAMWCPADSSEAANGNILDRNFSYSFNYAVGQVSGSVTTIKLSSVVRPAARIYIHEEIAPNDTWSVEGVAGNTEDNPSGRHGMGMGQKINSDIYLESGLGNHCFFDGHVESLSPNQINNTPSYVGPLNQ
jgi:type II secretory pathway pseudopilin PulG